MKTLALIILIAMTIGCSKSTGKEGAPKKPSLTEELIDGATGRTAVRHGRKAMDTIERVSKQEAKDLEEVLGE